MTDAPARHRIVGVMGPGSCDAEVYAQARQLGRLLAGAGVAVLCGGGGGVMEAASRGASEAGGLTIGILPGHDARETPPNDFIQIPIFTGISYARNFVNVVSSEVVVAVSGAHGTLSEIALALKVGKPVVLLGSWRFEAPACPPSPLLHRAADPQEAAAIVTRLLGLASGWV